MLAQSGNRVLGVYPNPRALQAVLNGRPAEPQILLIDADDPTSGLAALVEVRRTHPRLKILLLCEALTPTIIRCVLDEHIEGVVLKSDSIEEVILALRHLVDGRAVMPADWQAVTVNPAAAPPVESLSEREREILDLAAGGLRNKEIAERLMLSTNTVKFHLRSIYSRLGVHNRVQAAHLIARVQEDHPG